MTDSENNARPTIHERVYGDNSEVRVGSIDKVGKVIAFTGVKNQYQVSFDSGYQGTENGYSEWFDADDLTAT